jgi:hypothetical protein
LNSLEAALAEVRSGAVTPEARDTIMRALSLCLEVNITDDDDDHEDVVDDVTEPVEDGLPASPTPETPEATEPRAARKIDIARTLYLR